jgi:alpha-amylase
MAFHQSDHSAFLPSWAAPLTLYEVNVRQFTPEGTLAAFTAQLPRLHRMGVGIVWLMPIFPISTTRRKGSLGSYYSVSDYRAVHPALGTIGDLKQCIATAHELGMYVILDWVPNHTGWDHAWLQEHPEYYQKNRAGHITEPLNEHGQPLGWDDVAGLDYSNSSLRQAMVDEMIFWVREAGIDGFRQDMALLVPIDFWEEASVKLRAARPDLFLLAESEEVALLQRACFHAIYGWEMHHLLTRIAQGKATVEDIHHWMSAQKSRAEGGLFMHFTSNHDENAWSGSEIERLGEGYLAFAVLTMTLDGIPLVFGGQEEPVARRLAFFEKETIEFTHFRHAAFYTTLMQAKRRNRALWSGPEGGMLTILEANDQVLVYQRSRDAQAVTVAINLGKQSREWMPKEDIKGIEIFSQNALLLPANRIIRLAPWQYLVVEHT